MNRIIKILIIFLVNLILIGTINQTFAFSPKYISQIKPDYSIAANDNFKLDGFEDGSKADEISGKLKTSSGKVLVLIKYVCITLAVIILLVIGAKYTISAPGDRADIKKHAVAYVIGAIILFGASGILQIILEISKVIKA